ncbi:hypothetical protein J4230_05220 [Candidatus Woesearchaeota archaeon]|nr:hypothetical protein [Candidatus Woesearchaeota archaeon]
MGVFDFIRGKKKEEFEPAFDTTSSDLPGEEPSVENYDETLGKRFSPQPSDLQPQFTQISTANRDTDLILTKLELINQKLEVLDRRLQVIEKIAKESQ